MYSCRAFRRLAFPLANRLSAPRALSKPGSLAVPLLKSDTFRQISSISSPAIGSPINSSSSSFSSVHSMYSFSASAFSSIALSPLRAKSREDSQSRRRHGVSTGVSLERPVECMSVRSFATTQLRCHNNVSQDAAEQSALTRETSRGVHLIGWEGGREPPIGEDGLCEGVHTFRSEGGTYEGQWIYVEELKEWKPHGHGKFSYQSGNIYKGEWKNGQRCGTGRYEMAVAGGDIYEGQWFNDKFHGEGKIIKAENGKVAFGVWEHGSVKGELVFE